MRMIKIGLLCLLLSASQLLNAQTPIKLIVTDPSFAAFTAGDITAFREAIVTRRFVVRNTSNASFTGRILLKDIFGTSLTVEDITVSYEDGSLPKGAGANIIDANWTGVAKVLVSPTSNTDYYLDITNLPSSIGKNAGLIFTRRVKITDCIDDNAKGTSEVFLSVCTTTAGTTTCTNMTDAWENTSTRLIQRISKQQSAFVDIVDYEFRNGGYCAYNSTENNANGFRTVSLIAKMHNATSGETIERFGFQLSASDNAEIPNSRVHIFKARKSSSGKYVRTGPALNISPTVELNPAYSYIPVFLANPRCSPDAINYGFYEIGTMSGTDAYYIEFDVLNCQFPIDVKNLKTNNGQDAWGVSWRGLDNCNTILTSSPTMPASCGVSVDDQDIRPTSVLTAGAISGSNYGDYVTNKFTYTERVSSLFANTVGNNRLSNTFVSNSYAFLGTCYSDGFNYQVDRGKIIVALKMESGLNYYTGPTTGGYFDRMQFRNPDGTKWSPTSQLGSPTALYNIPTDETPVKNYDEVHFFEFDLTALYALYPAAQTATSNQKRSLLYQYLNASDLVYAMQADCGAPNQKDIVNYTVEMYFVLDGSCNNPFVFPSSKITRDAKIMCPGCMFPGGAGAGVSIQRSTFGYTDANDNHLPDNPAINWTESQVNAINTDNNPDNNIRTSFGIVGDHIKMKTEYYLTGSESCNGNTWNDMMIGPLTYSYLYINFPKDSIAIDTSIPIKFKIKSGSNTYSFTAPVSSIVDLGNGPTQHIFALNTSILNSYLDAGSPSLPNGFRFHSFDKIEYEFELNVLLNSNTTESYQEVFFTHLPYFSSVPLSQRTGDFPQFSCDPINGPSWKDANGNVTLIDLPPPYASNHPYSTTFLLCEGYETIFNLVPIIQQVRYDGTGGGATSETNPNCVKERNYGIVSSIGLLDEKRLFLNEIREAPYVNEIDVIIPDGYKLLEFSKSTYMYNDELPWYCRNEDIRNMHLTATSSQTFVVGGETYTKEHYIFPAPVLKSEDVVLTYDPATSNELRVFDEKSYQQVNVYFEAICNEIVDKPDLIADQSTSDQNVMNKIYFDHDNISPVDDYLMSKAVNFLKPSNGLTSTISTTGIVGAVTSSFNVNFALNQDAKKTLARYPFISIEYTPTDFSNFNLTSTSSYPITLIESTTLGNGNIKNLYSITINPTGTPTARFSIGENQSVLFNISGQLEKCFDNPNNPASFKVGYGWDCNGFPTSVAEADAKCFIQEEEVKVYSIESGLQSELTAKSEGDLCTNPKIKYTHRLVSTGSQVNQVKYIIDLPTGLNLAPATINIQYGGTTFSTSDYTLTDISAGTNTEVYSLQLNSSTLAAIPFAGAVVQGTRQEELILTFNATVASGCNVYQATSLTTIDVTAINFCSSIFNNHTEITPEYTACDNTYTVSIEGDQLYCANANVATPITLKAILPPLGPNVCYTLPMNYKWNIAGDPTIIGTSSTLTRTITQATTFELNTTDAAGRKAFATYTVAYDVEYQIGSYQYVCGDPNKTFCLPIDAKRTVRNGIIGMDFCLKYDKRYVTPNTAVNNANLGNVVTSNGTFSATYFMTANTSPVIEPNPNIGYVHVTIYYTMSASNNAAQFNGLGRVICVPFTIVGNPPVGQGFSFEMCEMYESYTLQERKVCWGPGRFDVVNSPNMKGQLLYYQPNTVALSQQTDAGFPYYVQNKINTTIACVAPTINNYTTDLNGLFNFNIGTATTFSIERDIHNTFTTPYSWYFRNFVNAVDTRAMEFVATQNYTSIFTGTSTFKPTAAQMIAGDVNMSDSLRANDITLAQKRMLGLIGEYPQVQNRVGSPSLDWRFIEDAYFTTLADYTSSTLYPYTDGTNRYWRDNVPNVPKCFSIKKQCYDSPTPLYKGILLGDLINSSSAYYSNPYIREGERAAYYFEVDIDNAIAVSGREYLIPVNYKTPDTTSAYAFDFDLDYQADSILVAGLSMDSKIEAKGSRLAWTNAGQDATIKSTNYTMGFWSKEGTVYYISVIRFNDKPLSANDFKEGRGLINGTDAKVYIKGTKTAGTTGTEGSIGEKGWFAQVIPNPANDQGKIVYQFTNSSPDNSIKIVDVIGHELNNYSNLSQEGAVYLNELPSGMYIAHVFDKSTGTTQIVKFIKK